MEEIALIEELIRDNPFAKMLQFKFIEFNEERTAATMVVRDEFMNINGQIHGGILFSFCDSVAGLTARVRGGQSTTIDGSINYLTNAPGGKLRAECLCQRQGRKISVYTVSVFSENEDLLCISTLTMYHGSKKVQR